jgi:hypothetical protein
MAIFKPPSSTPITFTRTGRCHSAPASAAICKKGNGSEKFPNGLRVDEVKLTGVRGEAVLRTLKSTAGKVSQDQPAFRQTPIVA